MSETLDSVIARLQVIGDWNIYQLAANEPTPFYKVTGAVVRDLVVPDGDITDQLQAVAAPIAHWGRWAAQAKRIWEVEEHLYRIWRDGFALTLIDPEGREKGWKKPTQAQVDQTVRTHPKYVEWQIKLERAEEAYLATQAVYEAMRAKKDVLKTLWFKNRDERAPTYGA